MSEIVFTHTGNDAADRKVRRQAEVGTLRKIVPRVYTTNLRDPLEAVLRRNVWAILGKLYPGAVISGRSAAFARPVHRTDAEGRQTGPAYVFLTGASRRSASLPGLELRIAAGPGPLHGDIPFQGLYLASPARHLLENLSPTRERSGMARGLTRDEVETFLVRQCDIAGEARLRELRDRARDLQAPLHAERAFQELDRLIGALLRSRAATLRTPGALALARGEPIDAACVDRLNRLFSFLHETPMPRRPDLGVATQAAATTAFIEAYFSNDIEGTRFLVEEARAIVFDGVIPERRPQDGRDVLATFRQLAAVEDMMRPPKTFEAFEAVLKARHHALLEARPEVAPGEFKTTPNQAGNTIFVRPRLVRGTLRCGFELLAGLDEPFARALFTHFLVAEIHPFADGNGRISRIFMTAELVRASLARIIIPTVYRDDYLGSMRALSRHDDPAPMVRCLDRAQEIAAGIVAENVEEAILAWARTHAFVEADPHARFERSDPAVPVAWRDGVPAPQTYWDTVARPGSLPTI